MTRAATPLFAAARRRRVALSELTARSSGFVRQRIGYGSEPPAAAIGEEPTIDGRMDAGRLNTEHDAAGDMLQASTKAGAILQP